MTVNTFRPCHSWIWIKRTFHRSLLCLWSFDVVELLFLWQRLSSTYEKTWHFILWEFTKSVISFFRIHLRLLIFSYALRRTFNEVNSILVFIRHKIVKQIWTQRTFCLESHKRDHCLIIVPYIYRKDDMLHHYAIEKIYAVSKQMYN